MIEIPEFPKDAIVAEVSIYDATGKITSVAKLSPSTYNYYVSAKIPFVSGIFDSTTQMISDGAVVQRPLSPIKIIGSTTIAARGEESITIKGVPKGKSLKVSGRINTSCVCDGSDVTMTFALPGTYLIYIDSFPFQDFEVTINAI